MTGNDVKTTIRMTASLWGSMFVFDFILILSTLEYNIEM